MQLKQAYQRIDFKYVRPVILLRFQKSICKCFQRTLCFHCLRQTESWNVRSVFAICLLAYEGTDGPLKSVFCAHLFNRGGLGIHPHFEAHDYPCPNQACCCLSDEEAFRAAHGEQGHILRTNCRHQNRAQRSVTQIQEGNIMKQTTL